MTVGDGASSGCRPRPWISWYVQSLAQFLSLALHLDGFAEQLHEECLSTNVLPLGQRTND